MEIKTQTLHVDHDTKHYGALIIGGSGYWYELRVWGSHARNKAAQAKVIQHVGFGGAFDSANDQLGQKILKSGYRDKIVYQPSINDVGSTLELEALIDKKLNELGFRKLSKGADQALANLTLELGGQLNLKEGEPGERKRPVQQDLSFDDYEDAGGF